MPAIVAAVTPAAPLVFIIERRLNGMFRQNAEVAGYEVILTT